jgi:threonyl-tRNA synthetase
MGPHVPGTGKIKAFKIMSVAQSHWHGDVSSDKFQRVYGTAFFDQKKLDEHLKMLDERRSATTASSGRSSGCSPSTTRSARADPLEAQGRDRPPGAAELHQRAPAPPGLQQVFTPHIGRLELYRTSGHYPYYRESQFPPLIDREQIDALAKDNCGCAELSNRMEKGEIDGYLLKPMNCPMHIKIFASEQRSYRDMPVRLAEFGTVYRWEKSGELAG